MKKIALSLPMAKQLIESQVGCGYCKNEKGCAKRDPKVNKAKLGCEEYEHYLVSKKP